MTVLIVEWLGHVRWCGVLPGDCHLGSPSLESWLRSLEAYLRIIILYLAPKMAMIIYRTPLSSFLTNSFPLLSLSRQEMSQFVVVFGKKY